MSLNDIVLKSDICFAALDGLGFTRADRPRVTGMFLFDTRHLSTWQWDFAGFDLSEAATGQGTITQFWSRFVRHTQVLLIRREFALAPGGFEDRLTIRNEALEPQTLRLSLSAEADFVDCFELRGRKREVGRNAVETSRSDQGMTFRYAAQDGVVSTTDIRFDGFQIGADLTLRPGEERVVGATVRFTTTLGEIPKAPPAISWTSAAKALRQTGSPAIRQAFADIDTLASTSPQGTYLAAGIPNFVTAFGRDGLIAAWFLLDAAPDIAAGTLRHLAAYQGTTVDDIRDEEPGKIAHELRFSELARCGDVPFGRYYGTTDATMLFVILLRDYLAATGDAGILTELEGPFRAALAWVEARQDSEGLVRYRASRIGKGLLNSSWKDSDDGMFFSDGNLATGQIAVVEIQGYAAAALEAAADLLDRLGETGANPARLRAKAKDLKDLIEARFWNETLGIHVIAVDGENRQCDTVSSNPGHLLWAGCLTPDRAAGVAKRLMQPDMWSGWGLRTVATGASRYQPLSYHNGSVWPHDTGMFAAGLVRYGLTADARTVAHAIHDAALRQPGHQLPELFGGYARDGDTPPLIYIETCRPQAWAAAAMIWAAGMLDAPA
jgi:glycogen debranching enzyme